MSSTMLRAGSIVVLLGTGVSLVLLLNHRTQLYLKDLEQEVSHPTIQLPVLMSEPLEPAVNQGPTERPALVAPAPSSPGAIDRAREILEQRMLELEQ